MPSTTWTPPALASSARRYQRVLWRVVEAQHTASTMRLADSLAEQALLEGILEASKLALLPGTERLHYLLATPFRYRPRAGSRFRAPFEAGVWYGAEDLRTSLAEKSYWQLRFLLDSPGTPDLKPVPHTAFSVGVRGSAVDLTAAPLAKDRALWTDRRDYGATQALASAAREARIELIRYESVRDPQHASCVAALTPTVFGRAKPKGAHTWFIAASRERVRCVSGARGGDTWEFAASILV